MDATTAYENRRYTPEELAELRGSAPTVRDPDAIRRFLHREFRALVADELGDLEGQVGLLLSGGVDSALALGLLIENGVRPVCFTAGDSASPDVTHARRLAESLELKWIHCDLARSALDESLRSVVALLHFAGLYTVASGMLLDLCFSRARGEAVDHVFTGNGIDLLFGGGVDQSIINRESGDSFHDRFWNYTLPLVERWYATPDDINLYGTIAARHRIHLHMPFEGFRAAWIARTVDAGGFYQNSVDKAPLRELVQSFGFPSSAAYRTKDPFQRSSGLLDALQESMLSEAPQVVPDQMSARYDPGDDPWLALRFYVRLVAEREQQGLARRGAACAVRE